MSIDSVKNYAAPIRLEIQRRLTSLIESAPLTGPLAGNTLNGAVFRGRLVFDDSDPLPMVSIIEPPIPEKAPDEKRDRSETRSNYQLVIQGFAKDEKRHPSDVLHFLLADVKKALSNEKLKSANYNILDFDGKVMEMYVGPGAVRSASDPSERAFFWLTLNLEIVEDLQNPYDY
jgi:hypothetical protein